MAKVAVNTFLLLRRTYAVAAENVRVGTAAVATRKAGDSSGVRVGPDQINEASASASASASAGGGKREAVDVFWMRDPKTGNWIPETHFGDVDVADLRNKFLVKKANH